MLAVNLSPMFPSCLPNTADLDLYRPRIFGNSPSLSSATVAAEGTWVVSAGDKEGRVRFFTKLRTEFWGVMLNGVCVRLLILWNGG